MGCCGEVKQTGEHEGTGRKLLQALHTGDRNLKDEAQF